MPDRKLQHGLHAMLELKERCESTEETETIASISYQRFFLRYHQMTGLSGTLAETRQELQEIYDLSVTRIPAHREVKHKLLRPEILKDRSSQLARLLEIVESRHSTGQPILIGTRTVDLSERVSDLLTVCKIDHHVLNARQDANEAAIVAKAGQLGSVTVATNMAGRGTDIPLDKTAAELGGLHVINLEINDSRRVDRQLFGRAARQGDPGSGQSVFSLNDEKIEKMPIFVKKLLTIATDHPTSVISAVLWRITIGWIHRDTEREQRYARKMVIKDYSNLKRRLAISGGTE